MKPTAKEEVLKAVQLVRQYLDEEECYSSETFWRDKEGYGFDCDIGELYEGLRDLERYLKARIDLKAYKKAVEQAEK